MPLPLLSLLPAITGVGPVLKKVFTNKYVLIGIVVAALLFGAWWAIDSHYELVEEYNTLSKNHNELIEKGDKERADYETQLDILRGNEAEHERLRVEHERLKGILGGIDFTKFVDAPAEVIEKADVEINTIIENSYNCIENATGKNTECVR
jgi:hypothetical protein